MSCIVDVFQDLLRVTNGSFSSGKRSTLPSFLTNTTHSPPTLQVSDHHQINWRWSCHPQLAMSCIFDAFHDFWRSRHAHLSEVRDPLLPTMTHPPPYHTVSMNLLDLQQGSRADEVARSPYESPSTSLSIAPSSCSSIDFPSSACESKVKVKNSSHSTLLVIDDQEATVSIDYP